MKILFGSAKAGQDPLVREELLQAAQAAAPADNRLLSISFVTAQV